MHLGARHNSGSRLNVTPLLFFKFKAVRSFFDAEVLEFDAEVNISYK